MSVDGHKAKYASAIDAVLADEFLTGAVMGVVWPLVSEDLAELASDLEHLRSDYAELMSIVRESDRQGLYRKNLRMIRHEIETPMRGHDSTGQCCLRAAHTPLPDER